jgi:PAS domain S-box-containing protein
MSETRFFQLMEKVTDFAILFQNKKGIIEEWNVGAENLFGYSRDEAIGRPASIIFTPKDLGEGIYEKELASAAAKGIAEDERWHISKDGSFFFASGLLHALYDRRGSLTGFVKIVRDLTHRIEMEAAIDDESSSLDIKIEERPPSDGHWTKVMRMELARQSRDDYLKLRLMQRAFQTQEDERVRISRDIHDHLGQQLTAFRLKLQLLKQRSGRGENLETEIDELAEMGSEIDRTVDFIAWELRPNSVTEVGLEKAIDTYVQQWSSQFKIPVEAKTVRHSEARLAAAAEINLYRIMQEALNNISKHARASKVAVLLENRGSEVVMIIEDDGVGLDMQKNDKVDGLGLIGMGERAALLQGTMEIESEPGKGTAVHVRVPAVYQEDGYGRTADA